MGKGPQDSLRLVQSLAAMAVLETPVLLAHSRKNFIGQIVGGTPIGRDPATIAATALGVAAEVDMVRVHDVPMNHQALRTADALVRR